jgi:hypothetical protein
MGLVPGMKLVVSGMKLVVPGMKLVDDRPRLLHFVDGLFAPGEGWPF